MPRTTTRANAKQRVIDTLRPEHIPDSPFGPGGFHLETEGSHLMPGSGNIRPYSGPQRERLSDAPNFRYTSMHDAPVLDRATGDITWGKVMRHNLDPEKHIQRTSRSPGATGMTGKSDTLPTSERAAAGMMGQPVPAYGGSTDARPGGLEHRSTRKVWNQKTREAAQPKGTTKRQRVFNPDTGRRQMADVPVHGAGLHDALMSGESIRSPAHLIVDPTPPKYGPRLNTAGHVEEGDEGGFGHNEPVQWQGHHRVAAAAMKQEKLRKSGAKDWSVPVPYELHMGTEHALSSIPWMETSEKITETRHKRRSMLRQVLGGNRGTWNPKAY